MRQVSASQAEGRETAPRHGERKLKAPRACGSTRGRPPAVVLGLSPNALGTVKALRRVGVRCIAIEEHADHPRYVDTWMSSRTRLCEKILLPRGAGKEAMLQALRELGPRLPGRSPIFPSADEHVFLLSDNAAELARWYSFAVPERETLALLMDKERFQPFAREHGAAVPRTLANPSLGELRDAARELSYPCFIKPAYRDSRWDSLFSPLKGLEVRGPEDLLSQYERALVAESRLLVQETVPGPDANLVFSHLYIRADGTVAGCWTGRKLRQLPIHFGTATFATTEDIPEVADMSLRLLRALRYRGYASVEFKQDARDGVFRVLEITAGRTWYNHYLGSVAGVNLEARWYEDLTGFPLDADAGVARAGVRWVDEYRDLMAVTEYQKAGELGQASWVDSYRGCRARALSSWEDPLPGLFVMARLGLSEVHAARRLVMRLLS